MRLRGLMVGTVTAALALSMAACGKSSDSGSANPSVDAQAKFEAGTTMAKLNESGKIRIGTKFDQPLFGLKGLDNKPTGFDVEVAKLVSAKLGLSADKIEWVETPSKVREEVIEQGKVDLVVATYTINDKRKERISFAGPYYEAGQDLMVKKDDSAITGPESLKSSGAKVCSVTGSTPAETIKKYVDESNIVLFDVYSKCADALKNNQVQAVTTDNVILLGLVDKSGGEYKLVGKPFTTEPYGIGIKKGDTKFCQFINDTLKAAANDGSYEKAWKDTAGKVAPNTPKLPETAACS
ncbi:glutamate ABC transporter substrate-binding protein [Actinokineospora diospyrosa]|uniref:Glutamate transport system substrate-binding protein n=1 Tax=Actinokineospora diospyrosa TaxID=103728 RepID=A0ABT1I4R0_9PSEU|nr:glutamate ABC transporter substrate-binding protein [Actinokineospora diospyrosa]MCP2267562.1 glutamate transport system substrate-binding protein [Actinokineospora diospyrosa]